MSFRLTMIIFSNSALIHICRSALPWTHDCSVGISLWTTRRHCKIMSSDDTAELLKLMFEAPHHTALAGPELPRADVIITPSPTPQTCSHIKTPEVPADHFLLSAPSHQSTPCAVPPHNLPASPPPTTQSPPLQRSHAIWGLPTPPESTLTSCPHQLYSQDPSAYFFQFPEQALCLLDLPIPQSRE